MGLTQLLVAILGGSSSYDPFILVKSPLQEQHSKRKSFARFRKWRRNTKPGNKTSRLIEAGRLEENISRLRGCFETALPSSVGGGLLETSGVLWVDRQEERGCTVN